MNSYQEAKKICEYLDEEYVPRVRITCFHCRNKTFILNIEHDQAYCENCNKFYKSLEEVMTLAEEDWLEDHDEIDKIMRQNHGVK